MRDLGWIEDQEGPLPHPAQDQAQWSALIAPTHGGAALMIV
jgi:hypothetical protein